MSLPPVLHNFKLRIFLRIIGLLVTCCNTYKYYFFNFPKNIDFTSLQNNDREEIGNATELLTQAHRTFYTSDVIQPSKSTVIFFFCFLWPFQNFKSNRVNGSMSRLWVPPTPSTCHPSALLSGWRRLCLHASLCQRCTSGPALYPLLANIQMSSEE